MEMRLQIDAGAGRGLDAADEVALNQRIAGAAAKENDDGQNRERGQNPRRVDDPAPDRMAAFALHLASASRNFSTRKRPRLSLSQRSACSLMLR